MYHSILNFIENDIKEIENLVAAMLKGEKEPHDLSQDIHDRMLGLGSRLIAELYEKIDDEIRESLIRKKKWNIEQRNEPRSCWISWGLSGSAGLATGIRNPENTFTSWTKSWGWKGIGGSRLERQHASWRRRYRPATRREAGPCPLWDRSANK